MNANAVTQLVIYFGVLLAIAKPLGQYMARVYEGRAGVFDAIVGPVERLVYRACGIRPDREMEWREYAVCLLAFNLIGLLAVYVLQRLQHVLPLNPQSLPAVSPELAMSTAISFATNTNWQSYCGETTLSYLTQMLGLTVQNFLSAATGMAVLAALVRGFARQNCSTLGNVWCDVTRSTLYILLPLSLILALLLVSQGVVQTFRPYQVVSLAQPTTDSDGRRVTEQVIALGPAASQVSIKQLGTNGGGFFNANSAHPLENPTPLSGFLECLAILLIPAALCFTFGRMVRDPRQGWAVLAAMLIVFVPLLAVCLAAEQRGTPVLSQPGIDCSYGEDRAGGSMEGKETRFGITQSALWIAATTAASSGSVNAMHDSCTPAGGLVAMWLMQLGEVIFGGAGSGLYGMIVFAIIAVFVAGLMVGRTPEYLGKKIEAFEMKMAALVILIPPLVVLIGTAASLAGDWGTSSISNPGPHGLSQVLYAFSSAGNNNGSAFAGLNANTAFYNFALGLAMLAARYGLIIPTLAIAGSLVAKKTVPVSAGTLPTHTPLFVTLLAAVVLLIGALTFVPALALGPIAEQLM
jgi:K+-transporting ATPase ATPase A chain